MQGKSKIYLDHNATTGLSPEVKAAVPLFLEEFGNPSSIHWASRGPKTWLRETRKKVAEALSVSPLEIVFTSGGSEANNAVIKSVKREGRNEFITTEVEHPSVLRAFEWLREQGAVVHFLKVNRQGRIDLEQYQSLLSNRTALVSVMFANNETGVIFPIREMAAAAHAVGAFFHSDCVQALGKVPLNLGELGVDAASFSAHKFYSLKGTGFLYLKKGFPFEPLIHGGGQERSRRGGTENTLGIAALGVAVEKLSEIVPRSRRMSELRDDLEARILSEISDVKITSDEAPRLPNTSSLVINGVDGETLLMSLDLKGFAVSTGAACSSGNPEPSPVLLAIGLSREEAQSSLRVSLGWDTTKEDIDSFLEALKAAVLRIRSLSVETEEAPSYVG
jgi:cysteine desulfurase